MTRRPTFETNHPSGLRRTLSHRRRWIFAVAFAFGVVGLALDVLTPPVYRATARLEIKKPPEITPWTGQTLPGGGHQSEFVSFYTDAELITNRALLTRLASDLNAPGSVLAERTDPGASWLPRWMRVPAAGASGWPAAPPAPARDPRFPSQSEITYEPAALREQLHWLGQAIRVTPIKDTRLVDISVEDSDPVVAQVIADRLARLFVAYRSERAFEADTSGFSFLQAQLAEVRERIERNRASLPVVRGDGGATRRAQLRSEASALRNEYERASRDEMALGAKTAALSRVTSGGEVALGTATSDLPAMKALAKQLESAQAELAQARAVYGNEHPRIQALSANVNEIRASIRAEASRSLADVRREQAYARSRASSVGSRLASIQDAASVPGRAVRRAPLRENELIADEELYARLVGRVRELGFDERMASPAVAIVDPATVDPDPVRPHRGLNLVVFLTAGLLLGVGGALLFDSLRRTIRTAQDVESELGLPVLATLPTRG
jgi:uncharacterized protein involved in exopolysaccharide biosynthesis